ncbi:MAG: RHS repeat protein, partial [Bacteroidales bacterium]|nr:RHS repeat protein [Bacteroidales bacterium]
MKTLFTLMTALVLGMSAVQLPAQEVSLYKRGSTYDENTMPPSPEPASVVKYAGVPFSHSSGLAEYDVPFHTLSGHELNIPIGLHYVSGGIRLDEIAGVAGLGWTLQAGGCVTRTVVDMPDEYSSALLTHQMPSGSLLTDLEAMTESTSATNYLRDLLWHRIDSSLDRYSYSVCGLSGTFVITDDGNVFQLSGDGVEITYTTASDGSVDTFTITGPDGTVYVLSEKETATHLGRGTAEFTPTSGEPDRWSATTAWHITQMRSRSGMETAHFTYSVPTGWNSSVYSISRSVSITVGSSGNIPSQGTSSTYVYKTHGTKVLTSISLCGQTATFSYATGTGSSSRTSYGAQQNFPFRLTGISVNAAGNPSELARLEVLTARDAYDGRIVLNGLRLYRGNTLDDKWAFTYRGVGRAVSHGSQDWYGFYNGENEFTDSGTHDICPYEYSQTVGLMITNGYPDPEYADYMSLKTADHDGAVATFAYEGNTITSGSDTYHLGVRVKTISVSDGMRIAYVRRFTYESPAASGPYVPVPDMYTIVNLSTRPSDTAELCDWSYSFHDTPVDIGTSIRDTRVYYGKVTEDVYERFLETTPASVRTVYRYDTSDMVPGNYVTTSRFPSEWRQYYDSMLLTPPFCSPWTGIRDGYLENKVMASPLLTRREDYACEDGTYTLVSSIDYTYDTAFRGSVLVDYRASQVAERNLTAVIFDYDNIYHFPVYALSWSGRHPVKEVHTGYHSSGNDVTEINTVYVARPGMGSPVRVQSVSTQEAGVTRMTMFTYADTWAGATGWVSDLRNQRALDMPLVQTLRYAYGSPSDSEDIRKTETQYGWFSIDGTLRLLPSVHKETNLGTESWRETVLSRDCMGNISSFQEKGEPQTVVIWGYGGQYPVAIINNATMTSVTSAMGGQAVIDALTEAESPSSAQKTALSGLRTSLSGAHVTTYEYIPGIGMSSRTDPAGMTVTYEYTTAGKLSCVRDHEGKKVEEHEYSLMSDGNRRRYMKSRVFRSDNGQQYAEDVIWWDAFGRRTQGISVSASGDGSDLVTAYGQDFMMHDDVKTWLPYPAQNTEGTFQTGAENASAAYHGSSLAYHHKRYETSARDRVISDALPGYAENHETSYETDVVTGFPVMVWNENAIVSSGTYPAGCIIVARTTDADGRIISTFSDHTGKTLGTSYGTDSPTYYIYDRYDRLRAVAGSGIQTSDTLDMWRYSYDALGRLASKGVPGSVREHYTYDTEDRIETISRNGVLREMEYDSFNRVVKVYVTRPGGTRTLLEQHTYDVYPAGVTGASPKGMKTASRIAQIGSDGNVSGYADISWSYDERKRPVQTVVRYGDAGVLSESTEYGFSGEVTSRTFAYTRGSDTDRMTLSYAYDVRGRMTTETATLDPSSGTSSSATLTHSYDALGRLSGTTAEVQGGIQVVTEQDYTLQGWIESLEVSVNEAVLFFQSLGYDGTDVLSGTVPLHTGIVTMKDEAWTSGGGAASTRTEGYAYDHVGRLSKEVLSEEIISYSYDYRGNILSVTGGTSPGTY